MKVEIGTASAAPGEKSYGRLNVAKTMARFDVFIPVIIVNGKEEGPTFVVSGAVHGDEILGSIAILKVAQNLDPAELKGTLIGVPVTNVAAFEMLDRATFWDGKILNRVKPNKDGTITEQLWYAFHNEIVNKGDYWLDIHCGRDTNVWYTGYRVPGPEDDPDIDPKVYKEMKDIALAFGVEQVMCKTPWEFTGLKKGAPARVLAEIGGGNWFIADEYVNASVKGITNIMKYLGMLAGKIEPQAEIAEIYDASWEIYNRKYGGFWDAKVKHGDTVEKGQVVGVVLHPFTGEVLDSIVSPVDGVIMNTGHMFKVVKPHRWLMLFGKLTEKVNLREYFK